MTRKQRQDRRVDEARAEFYRRVAEGLSFDERGALFFILLGRIEDRDSVPEDERLIAKAAT